MQADPDDLVEGRLVHHRQHAGQREHDRIGQGVRRLAVAGRDPREHLGAGLDLDVDLQTDDGFVVLILSHRGHRERMELTEPSA